MRRKLKYFFPHGLAFAVPRFSQKKKNTNLTPTAFHGHLSLLENTPCKYPSNHGNILRLSLHTNFGLLNSILGSDFISGESLALCSDSQVSPKALASSTNFSAAISQPILNRFLPFNFALSSLSISLKDCKLKGENRPNTAGEMNQ